MNKNILALALPNIITNITVPLLGMVDVAIVGRLSDLHIGAIAIGTSIFNLIYWNFGFLRMGTSGFTAQAYGAGDFRETIKVLIRACVIALTIAALLLALQMPIGGLSRLIFHGSDTVIDLAMTYFFIRIWAAPATLGLYGIKGWFIGMQNAKLPMWIAITLNVVNILCSLLFVVGFHLDIAGVALGTVVAQYSGLAMGIFFLRRNYGNLFRQWHWTQLVSEALCWKEMKRFFKVNGDIFLRTICLAAVFTFITSESGRISDRILAVDALLLQFFTLFSYIMDGFAYAGESLVGRYVGARDGHSLRSAVRWLFVWGGGLTLLFTILYALWGEQFLRIFSDNAGVIESTMDYLLWVLVIPVCGFAAFLLDGIFVGATASRSMRNSMFIATLAFFMVYYGFRYLQLPLGQTIESCQNNYLWTAFMVYLSLRGLLLFFQIKRKIYSLTYE